MRSWIIAASVCISGCGNSVDDEEAAKAWAYVERDIKDQRNVNSGIAGISYPSCTNVWQQARITTCGSAVFSKAMVECKQRASQWQGNGSRILDQWAGDSWIVTAGTSSVISDERRIEVMEETGHPSVSETIAVIVGQGTRDIVIYECHLRDLRLESVDRLERKTNNFY